MLVLSRRVGEAICIGDEIRVVVHRIEGSRVTIGIEAPMWVRIVRAELEPHSKRTPMEPDPGGESTD